MVTEHRFILSYTLQCIYITYCQQQSQLSLN